MLGNFSENSLRAYVYLLEGEVEFSENEIYDFTRCVRPDGTVYGTRGKCRKGTEEAKQSVEPKEKVSKPVESPKGYKPKEKEERKGLRGLKDRLLSKIKSNKALDSLVRSEEEIREAARWRQQEILRRLTNSGIKKKEREEIKKRLEKHEKDTEIQIARLGTNKKFTQTLLANLPRKVTASVDPNRGDIVLRQKVGKNIIETTFDQADGLNYRVNDKYDIGTVKDRKEQLRIAMAVRAQYDAIVRSLPENTVIKTSPYDGDGGGTARQRAYERIGFGKPDGLGEMFAMKKDGRMIPATGEQHFKSFENPDTVWFVENSEKENIKAWAQIVTGKDFGI